jgi:hypothetical protein
LVIDLSAATDRFPCDLQADLVSFSLGRHGASLGDLWARLLTDRGYVIPKNPVAVRYAAEQPMGRYSSWAVFALTHHLVVQWAACLAAKGPRLTEYTIFGDDLVAPEERVALQYQELM